ncbi:hypothetical protein PR048_017160 [Dryococelus australis]|uniref:Uncharacterized protein n=1 Tax=Dryococelus australis TaxID=614101 RepID=A0ABQ9H8Z1_9NEOP|nr:hypothetical protein PR048_017160 [Dryococelus australis]
MTQSLQQVLATDDSMSDDVFEAPDDAGRGTLSAPDAHQERCQQPSPTGYRDYQPPADVLRLYERAEEEVEQTVHKVTNILLPLLLAHPPLHHT